MRAAILAAILLAAPTVAVGELSFFERQTTRAAAAVGDAVAQNNLGIMYAQGQGVPLDLAEAVRWFRMAAEQGDADAQNNLGLMYDNGEGVPEDDVLAYAWFNLAAAQGEEGAREAKYLLAKRLTPEQVAEAQRKSRELAAQIAQ